MKRAPLAFAVAVVVAARSAKADEVRAPAPGPRITQSTQGGFITRPAGLYVRHDVRFYPGTSGLRVGLFDSFLSVSNEVGSFIGYATVPEWLSLQAEMAAEPGFFFRSPTAESRTFGLRTVARGQANINLRAGRYWLYSRSTVGLRLRNFDERDSFRGLILRREAWVEQATAFLVRANTQSTPRDPAFWLYGEYTVGRVSSAGSVQAQTGVTMPNRVSGGLITENVFARGLFLDLDLFWSFAPSPTDGFGVIGAFWIAWE